MARIAIANAATFPVNTAYFLPMIASLDLPSHRRANVRPHETDIIFPFRNPGLKLPPQPIGTKVNGPATVFSFRSLPTRRPAPNDEIELTTYCYASLPEVYTYWTNCGHLPHFMRAGVGPCDADAQGWRLRLRDEEVPWEAVTTEETPQKRIAWWSKGNRTHRNRGSVSFEAVGRKTTKVSVAIEFYESCTSAVTGETLRSLKANLDHSLDLLHLHLMPYSVLGPNPASL